MNFTDMRVGEIETFSYDYRYTLPAGQTIVAASASIIVHSGVDPNPQAMAASTPTINGTIVSIQLHALVSGVSYYPRMTATFSDGQEVTLPDPGEGSLRVVA